MDAVSVLTVYLVLLLAVPSSLTITSLGSVGKPAALWALGAAIWWAASQLQRFVPSRSGSPAVKITLFVFAGIVFFSYASALLRGLPLDEVSPADSSVLRLVGWMGIVLVAIDGIDDVERFRTLLRRVALGGTLTAVLGLLQSATRQSLLGWISIPGFSSDVSGVAGVDLRGGFLRASGTAIHPLEYGTVLCIALPLVITFAIDDVTRSRVLRIIPILLIGAAIVLAVSRSALVGAAAGVLVLVPGWPRRIKWIFASFSVVFIIAVGIFVPGIIGTLRGLFTGAAGDGSAVSRVDGVESATEVLGRLPFTGKGFGTFLPVYDILDDQYLLLAVEVGVLGLVAFIALLLCAVWSAYRARQLLRDPLDRGLSRALMGSTIAGALLLAFFDGFSFPISAGLIFLLIGLSGAALRVAQSVIL